MPLGDHGNRTWVDTGFDRDFERFAGLRVDWLQGDAVHEY
jgi:hypothetical protein